MQKNLQQQQKLQRLCVSSLISEGGKAAERISVFDLPAAPDRQAWDEHEASWEMGSVSFKQALGQILGVGRCKVCPLVWCALAQRGFNRNKGGGAALTRGPGAECIHRLTEAPLCQRASSEAEQPH